LRVDSRHRSPSATVPRSPTPSRSDRLQVVLGHAQVAQRVLSEDARVDADGQTVALRRDRSPRHRNLHAALSSAPVEPEAGERVLAEVKVRLRLDAKLLPNVLVVSMQ